MEFKFFPEYENIEEIENKEATINESFEKAHPFFKYLAYVNIMNSEKKLAFKKEFITKLAEDTKNYITESINKTKKELKKNKKKLKDEEINIMKQQLENLKGALEEIQENKTEINK